MLNIAIPENMQELTPKITVIGVGGAGGNAVNNMIESNLEGVDFVVANTDGQALGNSIAKRKIQLGLNITKGLGAGSKPDVGKSAAEESIEDILSELNDSNMVFITAGLGGGTGTGAAPVIAKASKERGILTVCVVTKPFEFEGAHRKTIAEEGINEIQKYADTLIVIPNQNLFRLANEKTSFAEAFGIADNVLHKGVCGVTDLMVKPGMINLDFADIRTVMSEMGKAMMGTGEASGDNRAIEAADSAINNPLLDETTMKGAKAVLINITGGTDMTLFEVDEAANRIRKEIDPNANIIFGSALDDTINGSIRVSLVATGISRQENEKIEPNNQDIQKVFSRENQLKVNTVEKITEDLDFNRENLKTDEEDDSMKSNNNRDQTKIEIEINTPEKNNDNLELDLMETESLDKNIEQNEASESTNLEKNVDRNNTFVPKKSIEISEVDNTESFNSKLNSFNNGENKYYDSDKESQSLINRITGFWSKNERLQSEKNFKEPTIERIQNSDELLSVNKIHNNNELDINISDENEKVLEIPAFLRRQAN